MTRRDYEVLVEAIILVIQNIQKEYKNFDATRLLQYIEYRIMNEKGGDVK